MTTALDRLPANMRTRIAVAPSPNDALEEPCWLWTGSCATNGYGHVKIGGKLRTTHQVTYELHHGHPVPPGLEPDHLCRIKRCCQPAHLEAVTHQVNIQRHFATKTHCNYGHPLSGPNLVMSRGRRECRTCNNKRKRDRRRQTSSSAPAFRSVDALTGRRAPAADDAAAGPHPVGASADVDLPGMSAPPAGSGGDA